MRSRLSLGHPATNMANQPYPCIGIITSIRHGDKADALAILQFNDKTNAGAVIPFGDVDAGDLVAQLSLAIRTNGANFVRCEHGHDSHQCAPGVMSASTA
jgi:hypothetical protein